MTYEEYENLCKQQQEKNQEYLVIFERDLIQAGLTQRTIKEHIFNVGFYINTYLLRAEPLEMEEGCGVKIHSYLGDFFIRKCAWSSSGTIKTTAASIKKFYKCMSEHGYISNNDYKVLCSFIKESMEIWQSDYEAYSKGDNLLGLFY
ncbi:MAG: recombinase [Candidatus Dojkabacteria bacterium]